MARENKFTFEPLRHIMDITMPKPLVISLNMKTGTMRFLKKSKDCDPMKAENLIGKLVRFYADKEKKVISFRVIGSGEGFEELIDVKKVIKSPIRSGYVIQTCDTTLKKVFPEYVNKSYKNIPLLEYKDNSTLANGEVYYYFSLNEQK